MFNFIFGLAVGCFLGVTFPGAENRSYGNI